MAEKEYYINNSKFNLMVNKNNNHIKNDFLPGPNREADKTVSNKITKLILKTIYRYVFQE